MFIAKKPTPDLQHHFFVPPSAAQVALRVQRPSQVEPRGQSVWMLVAKEPTHGFQHRFLVLPSCAQVALRVERPSQVESRGQSVWSLSPKSRRLAFSTASPVRERRGDAPRVPTAERKEGRGVMKNEIRNGSEMVGRSRWSGALVGLMLAGLQLTACGTAEDDGALAGGAAGSAEASGDATRVGPLAEPAALEEAAGAVTAAANTSTCKDNSYGGTWYCAYGHHSFNLPDGTNQFFVIGTDYAVWTRWRKNGVYSSWVSLGGQIRRSYSSSDFKVSSCSGQPVVFVVGTNNRWYLDVRGSNGKWSGWIQNNAIMCAA
jgi:hypothetical protein